MFPPQPPPPQEVEQMTCKMYPLVSAVFPPAMFPFLGRDTPLRTYILITLLSTTIMIKEGRIKGRRKRKGKRKREKKVKYLHTFMNFSFHPHKSP